MTYFLLDSGDQRKLEQFGPYILIRPSSNALWSPTLPKEKWNAAHAIFSREKGNAWRGKENLPVSWVIQIENLSFKLTPTDFGHLGIFPEHRLLWSWMQDKIQNAGFQPNILNLFAYSGAATLAAAQAGAKVCHVDASKGMVEWARENASLNKLEKAPIRWIIDDVHKFLQRENRRGSKYDGILLDPPSFGRGNKGELFIIEKNLLSLLKTCKSLLSEKPLFFIFSSHTPGMTPIVIQHLIQQLFENDKGIIECGELFIPSSGKSFSLPSGSYGKWYI